MDTENFVRKLADFEIRSRWALRKVGRPCRWKQGDRSLTEVDNFW